ncbi:MAG: TolC family protein [Proteobacteria bacterium]|nr:TolC family protein [Pseudomonadota bacterium]MCL2308293.1 TolC family protein [Pseudomonadota bacterium]
MKTTRDSGPGADRLKLKSTVLAWALLLAAPGAQALDLIDAWRAALTHDPTYAAAQAAHDVGATLNRQADALWRPTLALQAGTGIATLDNATRGAHFSAPGFGSSNNAAFDTSIRSGVGSYAGVELRQPLYDRERDAQSQQLRIGAQQAEQTWSDAQAELILRTAERYFDVALAYEQLRLIERQLDAVTRAQTEAQDRFKLGDKPITDVHEATARADGLRAQQWATQAQLELRQVALADLTGLPQADTVGLALPSHLPSSADIGELADWLERIAERAPAVQAAQLRLQNVQQEARKTELTLSPTIELVARAGHEHITGSFSNNASNRQTQGMIGVQLSLPLDIGGGRKARHNEAVAKVTQAQAELDRARQEATRQARAAWLGMSVGKSQVTALAAAVQASEARLDATRTGREVGDRTTLDLLNAENDAAAAQLALAQARVQVQLDGLRLAKLAGVLNEPRLQRLNDALKAGEAHP